MPPSALLLAAVIGVQALPDAHAAWQPGLVKQY
jgi:hypothetical protein